MYAALEFVGGVVGHLKLLRQRVRIANTHACARLILSIT